MIGNTRLAPKNLRHSPSHFEALRKHKIEKKRCVTYTYGLPDSTHHSRESARKPSPRLRKYCFEALVGSSLDQKALAFVAFHIPFKIMPLSCHVAYKQGSLDCKKNICSTSCSCPPPIP